MAKLKHLAHREMLQSVIRNGHLDINTRADAAFCSKIKQDKIEPVSFTEPNFAYLHIIKPPVRKGAMFYVYPFRQCLTI